MVAHEILQAIDLNLTKRREFEFRLFDVIGNYHFRNKEKGLNGQIVNGNTGCDGQLGTVIYLRVTGGSEIYSTLCKGPIYHTNHWPYARRIKLDLLDL